MTNSDNFIKLYAQFVQNCHVEPDKKMFNKHLQDMGVEDTNWKAYFSDMDNLRACAYKAYPAMSNDVLGESEFTSSEYFAKVEEAIRTHKSFLITTAVSFKNISQRAFNSFRTYCRKNNAQMFVLPSIDTNSTKQHLKIFLDYELKKEALVIGRDFSLTKDLIISGVVQPANRVDCLGGLDKMIAQVNGSVIVQGTKQQMKHIPVMKGKPDRLIISTGSVSVSDYSTDHAMSRRKAHQANLGHRFGAVLVDIREDGTYDLRQVRVSVDGSFTDWGTVYRPDGTTETVDEATMVFGDSHAGAHDESLFQTLLNIVSEDKFIKKIVLHDLCNASAVCHHEDNDFVQKTIRVEDGTAKIQQNIDEVNKYLNRLTEVSDAEIVVVNSNHDNHITKYVKEMRAVKNREFNNLRASAELFLMLIDDPNTNALEALCTANKSIPLNNKERITWLKPDESYTYKGIELGCHGHKGSNGGKGGVKATKVACGNAVIGHSHAGSIDGDCMQVGTTSRKDMGYNQGFSSWSNDCALCYSDGTKQLVSFQFDGEKYICGRKR